MDKVYILFDNYKYKLVIINIHSKLLSIDEKVIHIDEEDINRFLYILKLLNEKKNGNFIDPIRFSISYDNINNFINGNSNTCKNFNLLNDWLGEIDDR